MSEERSQATDVASEGADDRPGALPLWMGWAVAALVSTAVALVALIAYHHWFAPKVVRFATIDVAHVVDLKQLQLTAMTTKAGITDRDREAAFSELSVFARDIEQALNDVRAECDCTLLVRQAIVQASLPDMTEALKQKMGLNGLDARQLAADIAGKPVGPTSGSGTPAGEKKR
jgi:hypothetical protein